MSRWLKLVAIAAGASLAAGACASVDSSQRLAAGAPDRAAFKSVAPALIRRCGSLDCHGGQYRNFRLYGETTRRLASSDGPMSPPTTQAEIDADYDAVVGIEPEVMRTVMQGGGKTPELLTLYRKARGQEAHKGGERIAPGDPADRCLRTWLAGAVDSAACGEAANGP